MTRGRKPVPLNLRVVQGNPQKRKIDDDIPSPKVVVQIPHPPDNLSLAAMEHWPQFAEQLAKMRVLTDADLPALCMLCETYAIYWEAMDGVREFGLLTTTPNYFIRRSEYLATAFKAMDQCMKILVEFGLTPSSRMRVRQ